MARRLAQCQHRHNCYAGLMADHMKWCGGVAQRESTSLTSKGSQVQSLSLPPFPYKNQYINAVMIWPQSLLSHVVTGEFLWHLRMFLISTIAVAAFDLKKSAGIILSPSCMTMLQKSIPNHGYQK